MAQEIINVGPAPNDGQGDPLRTAFTKTNNNFSQLFAAGGVSGISNGTSNITILDSGAILMSPQGTANVITVTTTGATITGTLIGNPAVSAVGNVYAGQFFVGNGSLLTGVTSVAAAALITGNTLSSNVVTSSLTTVGTLVSLSVTGNVRSGNLVTPGAVAATGDISGSSVNAGLDVNAAGNVTGGNIITTGALSVGGTISGAGNVDIGTQYFIGNGSQLSGIAVSSNAALLVGTTLSSNVTISSLQQLGNLSWLVVSNALGNGTVSADGGFQTGTTVSATGNITGGNINSLGTVSSIGNLVATGNIAGGNASIGANLVVGNIEVATELKTLGYVTSVGNVIGSNLVTAGIATVTGNITGGNLFTAGTANVNSLRVPTTASVVGNITGANLITGGLITATGNITGNFLLGNIRDASGGYGNANVIANLAALGSNPVSTTGNITGGNIVTGAAVSAASVSASGTITGGTISATGDTILSGNLTVGGTNTYVNSSNFFTVDPIVGQGRNANNQPLLSTDNKDRGTQLYYFATSEKSSFIGYQASSGKLIAAVQVTNNNEVITVNSYGTLVVGTLEGATVSVTANVTGGNINTAGIVSAGGNITGANLLAAGLSLSSNVVSALNVTANIAGGNITTPGLVSVTGNITSGNVLTGGLISATGNITGGNLTIGGNTATITSANYQIGYRDLPQNTSFGTLAATDGGKHYYGSGTITIPSNANVAFVTGTAVLVVASASTSVVPQAGVTLILAGTGDTGTRTIGANGMATLLKVGTNTWYINGAGVS